ncbi:GntR family transcriptional regulator [Pseudonocardia spinosispora]|uniref:GntR family transcriptional regulator n=1 Tax=Pseudonocardia spinosispora TaxID=103441 RepID=UPI0003FA41AA|nr:GntR family transcriptional regulator [Pseudonocardia spinosispora]
MESQGLLADRALLGRTSTAERVGDILRTRISAGYFPPGARLAEEEITEALGVSRNTLREAFRLLTHERLLIHELNRGMFVRVPDVDDVHDLYAVRKHVQCSVVRTAPTSPELLAPIAETIRAGKVALAEQNWQALGTADISFHEEMVALAGSDRITELMRGVLAELRLVFHVMDNPRWFHEPYLARNEEILDALREGNGARADELLYKYLDDAERQLVETYVLRRAEHVK